MRKINFKMIVIRAVLIFCAFYLLCLMFCTVSVFNMHTLYYSSSGWGVVLVEYKLDFDNDLAEVNYYDNPGVSDGDHWHMIITYKEKEKHTYGSNAYPFMYRFVYDAIKSVVDTPSQNLP